MEILGRILGWLIISFLILTLFNYPVKLLNRKWIARMPRESKFRQAYQTFMRFIVRGHRYFAILTISMLLVHFYVQYTQYGLRKTGAAAGLLLALQGSLGAYGTYIRKKKLTAWFYLHRTGAVLLIIGIIIHVLKLWRYS